MDRSINSVSTVSPLQTSDTALRTLIVEEDQPDRQVRLPGVAQGGREQALRRSYGAVQNWKASLKAFNVTGDSPRNIRE
jgi:hypothetical protein